MEVSFQNDPPDLSSSHLQTKNPPDGALFRFGLPGDFLNLNGEASLGQAHLVGPIPERDYTCGKTIGTPVAEVAEGVQFLKSFD